MINGCCCRKTPTRLEKFFEGISTKTVRLDFPEDGQFRIPTYYVYPRRWWRIVLWIKRLPNRIYRYFRPYPAVTFNKFITPNFPFPVEELRKYNYDIRDLFKVNPRKDRYHVDK